MRDLGRKSLSPAQPHRCRMWGTGRVGWVEERNPPCPKELDVILASLVTQMACCKVGLAYNTRLNSEGE